jgi:hypothetical protein
MEFFFFEKDQNLNFWWYSKVLQVNCFWGDFGKIQQFWAVVFSRAKSMPKAKLKS